MKVLRKIIKIDEELCTGCGDCIVSCAEGAIEIVDGKAKIIKDLLCDGLGACMGSCPENALEIIEREADPFDEEAVEVHLKQMKESEPAKTPEPMGCGCPSSHIQSFGTVSPCASANIPSKLEGSAESALTHWPVKIRLVPPTAPFLKGADLLVLADCVPAAYPSLHQDLLKGRVVMMGCPKFDDAESYIQKFTEIFSSSGVKSITLARMEVPCCSGMQVIVERALKASGAELPLNEVIVSTRGNIV
jgi:Pyruvate/2-oxoacid:ferredoxin oxidoreductase delta subunit